MLVPKTSLLIVALLFGAVVSAQESATSQPSRPATGERSEAAQAIDEVDEVVVAPSRTAQPIRLVPRQVTVVDQDEAQVYRSPVNLPEALRQVPGVAVQKTATGQGSPYIRGFTGFRTVLLIDGVRLNNSAFRDGPNQYWSTVDLLSTEKLEVVKGPTSVLYGSDAAGGTLATYTESIDMGEDGGEWSLGARTYYRFSTAEASHSERVSLSAGYAGKFGVTIGETYRTFGDLDAGGEFGRQKNTGYDAWNVDAKFRAHAMDHVDVEFLFQHSRLNNVPRTHATVDGVSFHGTQIGTDLERDLDQERELALMSVLLDEGTFFKEASFKMGIHRQAEVQDRIRTNNRREKASFDVDQFFSVNQFTSDTPIGTLVYGADIYVDLVDSAQKTTNNGVVTNAIQGPVGDDATYGQYGVFVQDLIDVTSWGHLNVGVRYTHVDADIDKVRDPITGTKISIDESWDAVVGGVGFSAEATDWLVLYTSANVGFRAPNLSDLSRFDIARSGELETAAPGLDPEYFAGFEFGFKMDWNPVVFEAAYFYTELFDTIIRRPTGQTINNLLEVSKENGGDGHVQGVEVRLDWEFVEDFHLVGDYFWTEGVGDDFDSSQPIKSREPLGKIPPMQGTIGVEWRPTWCNFWAQADVDIVDNQDRLSPGDERDTQRIPPGGTPGYTVYNLRFGYNIDEKKHLFLHLENLSDKNYRVHGSGSQEAGFNAIVGFDMRF